MTKQEGPPAMVGFEHIKEAQVSRARDRMAKLLAVAPPLPEGDVIGELRARCQLSNKDVAMLKKEGAALRAFATDLAKYRYLDRLCEHNRIGMPKVIGVQLITNQFKWLETGMKQDLERIHTVLKWR